MPSKIPQFALAAAVVLALAACSGGGSVDEFSPTPQSLDISGTISGLNGSVDLTWNGGAVELTANGAFTVDDAFRSGESLTLALDSVPLQQRCEITSPADFSDRTSDIAGVNITCEDRNFVRVFVDDFDSGNFIAGVTVTAQWDAGAGLQTQEAATGVNGETGFEIEEFDGRIVLSADLPGYGEQTQVVVNTSTPTIHVAHLIMQEADLVTTFDVATGAALAVDSLAVVNVPPAALQDEAGTPYNGQVNAELTLIDPSSVPGLTPGDYLTLDGAQVQQPVETFGGIQLTLTGSAGELLNLIPGQSASVNMPVAAAAVATAPIAASLYYIDPLTGFGVNEGALSLQSVGGRTVYSGTVDHFSTWHAGSTYAVTPITGCVVDVQGNPLPNVTVSGEGVGFLGTTRTVSQADGSYSLPARDGSGLLVTASDGYQSQTLQAVAGGVLEECLVASLLATTINLSWGENPADLDTHFFGFSATNANDDFHVDWTDRSTTVNGVDIELDVDDVTSYGPEVVTVPTFPFEGVYRYAVHRFSGTGTIQSSPARVELNLGGTVYLFAPPEGTPTDCWSVFDIRVDDDGRSELTTINAWVPEEYCTAGSFDRPL